jgi:predicted MFS family arabinose efflux permease
MTPQTEPQGSRPVGQVNAVAAALGGLIATAAALGIGRFVYTPILPPMIEALKLSESEAGLIASANFVGYLIGTLLAAMPRLPGSRRLWLLGSLAVSAATTAGMGLGQTLAAFLILGSLAGLRVRSC